MGAGAVMASPDRGSSSPPTPASTALAPTPRPTTASPATRRTRCRRTPASCRATRPGRRGSSVCGAGAAVGPGSGAGRAAGGAGAGGGAGAVPAGATRRARRRPARVRRRRRARRRGSRAAAECSSGAAASGSSGAGGGRLEVALDPPRRRRAGRRGVGRRVGAGGRRSAGGRWGALGRRAVARRGAGRSGVAQRRRRDGGRGRRLESGGPGEGGTVARSGGSREGPGCDPSVAGSRGASGPLAGEVSAAGVVSPFPRWVSGGRSAVGSAGGARGTSVAGSRAGANAATRAVTGGGPPLADGPDVWVPAAARRRVAGATRGRSEGGPASEASGETAVGRRRCRQAAAAPAAAAPASAAIGASCRAHVEPGLRRPLSPSAPKIATGERRRRPGRSAAQEVSIGAQVGPSPAAPATRCRTAASGRRVHGPAATGAAAVASTSRL